MRPSLLASLTAALLSSSVALADECQPFTWKRDTKSTIKAGDFVCREAHSTGKHVDSGTCAEMADHFMTSLDDFLKFNPELDKECKSIKPNTHYCVYGFTEPKRAWDGLCGPDHDATCKGTSKGCCNKKTWKCGNEEEDCRADNCYEGLCLED